MSGAARIADTVRGFAVVDTETTGILPSWHHRIAEIAVVHVDRDGTITDQWSTLVNPGRDLGPQEIHGIRAADVRRAPRFGDIVGEILARLDGRVVVAHNWPFDAMHLRAEFGRTGLDTPWGSDAGLCTMRAAAGAGLASGRSLADCCAAAGLPSRSWHTASADALAAADLLGVLLQRYPQAVAVTEQQARAATWPWPRVSRDNVTPVHRSRAGQVEQHFLSRLVKCVPHDGEPEVDAYLAILDGALLDRHLSATEADELLDVAHELGLGRSDVVAIHVGYLRDLARAAWADQVVTREERRDIDAVAVLLGLDPERAQALLQEERSARTDARPVSGRAVTTGGLTLRPGDKVVLTGAMSRERDDIVAQATAAGVRVTTGVSKQTTMLVAADPDSLSGKAKKARQLAVPVVSEAAFLAVLDNTVTVDSIATRQAPCGAAADLSYDIV
jgi:DNA polymerase-3 subunit epsilon